MEKFKRIAESGKFEWLASSDGYVKRITRKDCGYERVKVLKPFRDDCYRLRIFVNGRFVYLSRVIADSFVPGYDASCIIRYKDGDKSNCAADNLVPVRQMSAVRTGNKTNHKPTPVIVRKPNGEEVEYRNQRECADALFISPKSIGDYLNGKIKYGGVLGEMGYELRRKGE